MKHTSIISAALLAALSLSCAKQQPADINILPEGSVKAVFTAQSDGLKATLDGTTVSWENGDQIAVYQYGYYKHEVLRDGTKNIFTTTGSAQFSGTIAGYKLLDPSEDVQGDNKNSRPERFYAVYPAASCSACGVTTAKYKITVPAEQTGLLADFKKSVIFVGSLDAADGDVTSYNKETGTLTFLKPFDMFCVTPVLKFNVPASLNVTGIKITGTDADGNAVGLASTNGFYVRSDANNYVKTGNLPEITELKISRGGSVISGDVYAIIAPSADAKDKDESYAYHLCTAKTLSFELTTSDGKSATLDLPITGEIRGTAIKKLPDFPAEIEWKLPEGPGIALISTNTTSNAGGNKLFITTEDETSTITYSAAKTLEGLTNPATEYDATEGIKREDSGNYIRIKTETEGYGPRIQNAIAWILSKSFGYGSWILVSTKTKGEDALGDSYTQYGLTFVASKLGTVYTYPYCKASGIDLMWKPSGDKPEEYPQWYVTLTAPETGKARMIFEQAGSSNARTFKVTNLTTGENVSVSNGKSSPGSIITPEFSVTAGDVLKFELSAQVVVSMIALLWEPEEATAEAINEQLDGTTPYNL